MGTDAEIAKVRKGDPDAIAGMIARYQHRLYRYLLRLVRDQTMAEDLFQQTWLRVIEKIGRFDARRNFDTWLFTVARNLAIDFLRRRQPESLDEPSGRAKLPVSGGPDALERYLRSERVALVMASVSELPAIYREVLTLRFEEEMKIEEIAELTDIPLSTVKSRLRRALIALRKTLTK